jgi:hypothetical protein
MFVQSMFVQKTLPGLVPSMAFRHIRGAQRQACRANRAARLETRPGMGASLSASCDKYGLR